MRIIRSLSTLIGLLSIVVTISCKSQLQKTYNTYIELTDNKPFDTLAWNSVNTGMNVSAASIDIRYKKNSVPEEGIIKGLSATAWRGERVNEQLVIWTTQNLSQVHCITSDLVDTNGNIIYAINIKSFFERYVMTDVFGKGCGHRNTSDYDSSLVADVLDPISYFDIEKNTTRPVWITIDIPRNTAPGIYSGKIIVDAKNQKERVIQYTQENSDGFEAIFQFINTLLINSIPRFPFSPAVLKM